MLPLCLHGHSSNTTCPGTYDLARVDCVARGLPIGKSAPAAPSTSKSAVPHITVDGSCGPATIRAIQAHLGVVQDGSFGPATVRPPQTRLNRNTF